MHALSDALSAFVTEEVESEFADKELLVAKAYDYLESLSKMCESDMSLAVSLTGFGDSLMKLSRSFGRESRGKQGMPISR